MLIALGVLAGIAVLAVGAGLSWYYASRTPLFVALVIACAPVAWAFVFQPKQAPRGGVSVAIDDSCDEPALDPSVLASVKTAIAPGVNGDSAVVLGFFADNAFTSRRIVLALTDPPGSGIRGDAVAYANWKAPRIQQAETAMKTLKTSPCSRVGTSVLGAAEAADDELTGAGVIGPRKIVLVTNLIEYSSALRIQALRFQPRDVPAAVQKIARLPRSLRPLLGRRVSVTVLFDPRVRGGGRDTPLAESTAVALKTWAYDVFHGVLHAGSVHFEIVATGN